MALEYAERNGCDAIVQVGDFGMWVDNWQTAQYLDTVQQEADEWDIDFYWLDGNHEDHSRIDHGWPTAQYTAGHRRVIYLPRGYRWTWWGKRFMAVGGAVSVDKHVRTPGESWWPEEELTDRQLEYACRDDGTPVDVILAHDCPGGVDIPGITLAGGLQNGFRMEALLDADRHRAKVRQIFDAVQPRLWIHGHYHEPYQAVVDGATFCGLSCDRDHMFNLARVLTPEGLE